MAFIFAHEFENKADIRKLPIFHMDWKMLTIFMAQGTVNRPFIKIDSRVHANPRHSKSLTKSKVEKHNQALSSHSLVQSYMQNPFEIKSYLKLFHNI